MLKKVLILGLAAGASASRSTLSASPSTDSDNSNAFPSDEELVAGSSDLPEYFDSRSAWFGCGLTVLDQGRCGSCWAVAATGVLGDRVCVHKSEFNTPINLDPLTHEGRFGSGTLNREFMAAGSCRAPGDSIRDHGCFRKALFLSPQPLISCGLAAENDTLYPEDQGCNGGNALEAFRFNYFTGSPTMGATGYDGCAPYTSWYCVTDPFHPGGDPDSDGCRKCAGLLQQCSDTGKEPMLYKIKSFGHFNFPYLPEKQDPAIDRPVTPEVRARELYMMKEIYTNGPIMACIFDYDNWNDFYNQYPLGVYNNTEGSIPTGGHCMNLLGWGVDRLTGMKYWLLRNSWGSGWGSVGVARIKKGVDYLGIESDAWAACPEGSVSCELTDGVDTSVMALDQGALRAAGRPTGRGGYWQEVAVDSPPVVRTLRAFLASSAGQEVSAQEAGVTVQKAYTQVARGLKVHLELSVPAAALSKATSSRSPAAMAVSLKEHVQRLRGAAAAAAAAVKKKKAGGLQELFGALVGAGDIDNHGCTIGPSCAGRSHSTVNGQMFCCQEGCGNSCSISVSSSNGHTTSVCSCSRKIAITIHQNWETGSYEQLGHAFLVEEGAASEAAADAAAVETAVASSGVATQSA